MADKDIRSAEKGKMEPKVAEAVAEIHDSAPHGFGYNMPEHLEKRVALDIKSRTAYHNGQIEEWRATKDRANGVGGDLAFIALELTPRNPDGTSQLDKQLLTITEGVISPEKLHDLEKKYSAGREEGLHGDSFNAKIEGSYAVNVAYAQIVDALQKGVDRAIDKPLETPAVQKAAAEITHNH